MEDTSVITMLRIKDGLIELHQTYSLLFYKKKKLISYLLKTLVCFIKFLFQLKNKHFLKIILHQNLNILSTNSLNSLLNEEYFNYNFIK